MISSAMAMGSDLFEPVGHFEEEAEAEQAEEGEEQGGHGCSRVDLAEAVRCWFRHALPNAVPIGAIKAGSGAQ